MTRIQKLHAKAEAFEETEGERLAFSLFYGLAIALLLFASFFDQSVSRVVMDRQSIVGAFFQKYGVFGPNIVLFASFQIVAWASFFSKRGLIQRLALTTVFLLLATNQVLLSLKGYFAYTLARILNGEGRQVGDPELGQWLVGLALSLALSACFYFYLKNRREEDRQYLLKAALYGIALVFIVSLLIGDLKLHWGRYRPFQMDATMSQFTPWYHPNGANGHYSFPSGHTTSGWLMTYLPFLLPRSWRKSQRILLIVTVTLAIVIALSRVRYGAHWLSDVTGASLIVFSMILLVSRLLPAHFVEEKG
ncbi:phosphatase PAP2 family protein [Fructobacillus papyrifericola]|uniref:Phosphatase PAP2 family protein n=1 Tax=Fructobacillus papyrifericola TaxID=2713172 RepID=A0ABS5QSL1_9LACO|nr:phosphatase PAP2 family protein [Fructobacillus papyrifericola]MBS9336184.1 phosphatase PAP2 family protein [Fructobacillus papyrifericola]